MAANVIEVHVPEYSVKSKPDYVEIGKKVDKAVEKNFSDGKYIIRAIGSDDHPGLSLHKLTQIILKTGTDKYDPKRKGVAHEDFSGYDYDIQASIIEIRDSKLVIPEDYKYPTEFGDMVWHFYEHTLLDRGYPVRIDLLIIYDPKKLTRAIKIHPKAKSARRGLNKYLYKFKNPENKKDALLGVVKILR
ncbi:hypothetical protein GF343_01685 [Candidatus Woesearchaeota archaeon]|nr:hypothetical protein [Candidatus Woesearchaeota archaeon]